MPILPRFFLVTSQSGVNSMSISLENPTERAGHPGFPYTIFLECANAVWTYRYTNGYIVRLRGPLTAQLVPQPNLYSPQPVPNGMPQPPYSFKFDSITFASKTHEKALLLEAIEGTRSEPIQRTPRLRPEPNPHAMGSPSQDEDPAGGDFVVVIERAIIPTEPVNAFGIPQATMRCLEVWLVPHLDHS